MDYWRLSKQTAAPTELTSKYHGKISKEKMVKKCRSTSHDIIFISQRILHTFMSSANSIPKRRCDHLQIIQFPGNTWHGFCFRCAAEKLYFIQDQSTDYDCADDTMIIGLITECLHDLHDEQYDISSAVQFILQSIKRFFMNENYQCCRNIGRACQNIFSLLENIPVEAFLLSDADSDHSGSILNTVINEILEHFHIIGKVLALEIQKKQTNAQDYGTRPPQHLSLDQRLLTVNGLLSILNRFIEIKAHPQMAAARTKSTICDAAVSILHLTIRRRLFHRYCDEFSGILTTRANMIRFVESALKDSNRQDSVKMGSTLCWKTVISVSLRELLEGSNAQHEDTRLPYQNDIFALLTSIAKIDKHAVLQSVLELPSPEVAYLQRLSAKVMNVNDTNDQRDQIPQQIIASIQGLLFFLQLLQPSNISNLYLGEMRTHSWTSSQIDFSKVLLGNTCTYSSCLIALLDRLAERRLAENLWGVSITTFTMASLSIACPHLYYHFSNFTTSICKKLVTIYAQVLNLLDEAAPIESDEIFPQHVQSLYLSINQETNLSQMPKVAWCCCILNNLTLVSDGALKHLRGSSAEVFKCILTSECFRIGCILNCHIAVLFSMRLLSVLDGAWTQYCSQSFFEKRYEYCCRCAESIAACLKEKVTRRRSAVENTIAHLNRPIEMLLELYESLSSDPQYEEVQERFNQIGAQILAIFEHLSIDGVWRAKSTRMLTKTITLLACSKNLPGMFFMCNSLSTAKYREIHEAICREVFIQLGKYHGDESRNNEPGLSGRPELDSLLQCYAMFISRYMSDSIEENQTRPSDEESLTIEELQELVSNVILHSKVAPETHEENDPTVVATRIVAQLSSCLRSGGAQSAKIKLKTKRWVILYCSLCHDTQGDLVLSRVADILRPPFDAFGSIHSLNTVFSLLHRPGRIHAIYGTVLFQLLIETIVDDANVAYSRSCCSPTITVLLHCGPALSICQFDSTCWTQALAKVIDGCCRSGASIVDSLTCYWAQCAKDSPDLSKKCKSSFLDFLLYSMDQHIELRCSTANQSIRELVCTLTRSWDIYALLVRQESIALSAEATERGSISSENCQNGSQHPKECLSHIDSIGTRILRFLDSEKTGCNLKDSIDVDDVHIQLLRAAIGAIYYTVQTVICSNREESDISIIFTIVEKCHAIVKMIHDETGRALKLKDTSLKLLNLACTPTIMEAGRDVLDTGIHSQQGYHSDWIFKYNSIRKLLNRDTKLSPPKENIHGEAMGCYIESLFSEFNMRAPWSADIGSESRAHQIIQSHKVSLHSPLGVSRIPLRRAFLQENLRCYTRPLGASNPRDFEHIAAAFLCGGLRLIQKDFADVTWHRSCILACHEMLFQCHLYNQHVHNHQLGNERKQLPVPQIGFALQGATLYCSILLSIEKQSLPEPLRSPVWQHMIDRLIDSGERGKSPTKWLLQNNEGPFNINVESATSNELLAMIISVAVKIKQHDQAP